MLLKSFLVEDRDPFILHSQHHCCWWLGVVRKHAMHQQERYCSHDDVIKWKHFPRYWILAICAGNSPAQRPVTRSLVFFDLRLNKRLSKQTWGWWFETLSRPLWRHCNVILPEHSGFSHRRANFHSICLDFVVRCPYSMNLSHKSHNAPFPHPIIHHFVTEMCTCVFVEYFSRPVYTTPVHSENFLTGVCGTGFQSDTLG